MQRIDLKRASMAALLLSITACTSKDTSGPDNNNSGSRLTARIDGVPWASDAGSELVGVLYAVPGVYGLAGSKVSAGNNLAMVISLANISGPGTYPLGVGPSVPGGSVVLSTAAGGWATPNTGADGTINITTLTSTRIAGTFSFTVSALVGSATGNKTVTDGVFDLEVKPQGTVGALPDNAGSKVSASLNGAAWNAAAVNGNISGPSNTFVVAALNNARGLNITLANVPGPGTYALSASSSRSIGVINGVNSQSNTWSSSGTGGSGSVIITSVTATRIRGTFTATLAPAPGSQTTGTIVVTNGVFDLGRLF